ncbi:MAG: VWA domain-containing protein [Phycisphaerales bacterium]|nr:VWA domain-containing protein [Phycisphaerales bacterium]MCB9855026.1 VWA domain-containing protein [Phycisphaerales bacterium]MCB9863457.1 VWA domain-containing protein [Phycisphaerales bacterium]
MCPLGFRRLFVFAVAAASAVQVSAQTVAPGQPARRPISANVIVPQSRHFGCIQTPGLIVEQVDANVDIVEQVATTTLEVVLRNGGGVQAEAELLIPVPVGAVVRDFAYDGFSTASRVEILPADEARRIYDQIVARMRDPALLEFAGMQVIRSSVFPIPPGGSQKVRVGYECILPRDVDRVDYVLPRSESLDYRVPWSANVKIRAKRPISTVYSPSHEIEVRRAAENVVNVSLTSGRPVQPGAFRLSYLLETDGVNATLMAYPDSSIGGGYFLLLGGLPAHNDNDGSSIKRELTLVLDRSGSMSGEKIEQVREAAKQIIAGLSQGEAFNIITYSDTLTSFSARPVLKNAETERDARAFLDGVQSNGGTDIHSALTEALKQPPTKDMLPLVLFLTDGLPTVGNTSELAIRELVTKSNPHNRRVYTFGVGSDVNGPLLDKLASASRGMATYVLPGEDVEVKVAQVFRGLKGPVLTDPVLASAGGGRPRVGDVLPAKIDDLFEGGQFIVMGTYRGNAPLEFTLSGNYRGKERVFAFSFPVDKATVRNAFVPRLWASRKIGVLIDSITQLGGTGSQIATNDPRMRELVDEVVRLGTKYGILTEYTAFLAREGVDLSNREEVAKAADGNFRDRAVASRTGLGSVNQAMNGSSMRAQSCANAGNEFFDENMNRVSVSNVQQVCDLAFYRRGGRWVDSRVVEKEKDLEPARTVVVGSDEYKKIVGRLVEESRVGAISLEGDMLIVVGGETVLVKSKDDTAAALPPAPTAVVEKDPDC